MLVDQHAFGHRHALVARDPRLAEGDGAGRHVEQQPASPSAPGTPAANGLVPSRASLQPKGACIGAWSATLTKWTETMPAAAHCSAQWPIRPICALLRRATAHRACALARSMPRRIASLAMAWPKPRRASSTRTPPRSATSCEGLVRHQQAGVQQPHIVRQHADAVAVVPGEVGGDQMVGDVLRLGLAAAHGADVRVTRSNRRRTGWSAWSCRPVAAPVLTAGLRCYQSRRPARRPTDSVRQSARATIGDDRPHGPSSVAASSADGAAPAASRP